MSVIVDRSSGMEQGCTTNHPPLIVSFITNFVGRSMADKIADLSRPLIETIGIIINHPQGRCMKRVDAALMAPDKRSVYLFSEDLFYKLTPDNLGMPFLSKGT